MTAVIAWTQGSMIRVGAKSGAARARCRCSQVLRRPARWAQPNVGVRGIADHPGHGELRRGLLRGKPEDQRFRLGDACTLGDDPGQRDACRGGAAQPQLLLTHRAVADHHRDPACAARMIQGPRDRRVEFDWLVSEDRDDLEPGKRLAASTRERLGLAGLGEADVLAELRRGFADDCASSAGEPAAAVQRTAQRRNAAARSISVLSRSGRGSGTRATLSGKGTLAPSDVAESEFDHTRCNFQYRLAPAFPPRAGFRPSPGPGRRSALTWPGSRSDDGAGYFRHVAHW